MSSAPPIEDHPTHARDSWGGLLLCGLLLLLSWAGSSFFPGVTRFRFAEWGAGQWAVALLFAAGVVLAGVWSSWRNGFCVCPRCSNKLTFAFSDSRFAYFPCVGCGLVWRSSFKRAREDQA